jgi:glycosyltransferase involved in cell wall biosynthesis
VDAFVSVILPFRDAAATLDEALAGLLASGDPALELIAIDDGSSDGGAARVRAHAARDARVRLASSDGRGLVAALNTGVALARGELIARMDADDVAHPERIARQRAHLLARPQVAALGTRVHAFADDGEVGEGLARYVDWQNALITPEEHARERFVESPLCHPSIMLRRGALARAGVYRELDGPEDYELFLRLVEHGFALAKLPEVLLSWRHRSGRATFGDARYGLDKFRAVKAPYLAAAVRRAQRERHVLWGAGPTGRRMARALRQHGVRVERFIDIDPGKIGRSAQGAPICAPDALDAHRDVVIVAVGARGARALIRPELAARGFREGATAWFAA